MAGKTFAKILAVFLLSTPSAFALPLVLNAGGDAHVMICAQNLWPSVLRLPATQTSQFAPVLGRWRYDGFFYDGNRYPNPNPDLDLEFQFREDGVSRLYWERKDEPGFCERLADYEVVGTELRQRVTWVNPENASSCGRDPDMQNGRATAVPFERKGQELWLNIGLSGKDFFYILKSRGEDGATDEAASAF